MKSRFAGSGDFIALRAISLKLSRFFRRGLKNTENCDIIDLTQASNDGKAVDFLDGSIFNENMTSNEARTARFKAVEEKTESEIEQLKIQYARVIPIILEREHRLASEGWLD
jgi:hypothetical protein